MPKTVYTSLVDKKGKEICVLETFEHPLKAVFNRFGLNQVAIAKITNNSQPQVSNCLRDVGSTLSDERRNRILELGLRLMIREFMKNVYAEYYGKDKTFMRKIKKQQSKEEK